MLHLKTMSNISKVAVAVGGVLFRLEWPQCNASMLLPLRSSPTLPPPFAFAILCNAGSIHSATGKSDAPYLFSQRKCHSPLQRGKAHSLPAFPSSFPVSSSTTELRRGNNAATTFRSRLRRKMAMLVNDGQGKVGKLRAQPTFCTFPICSKFLVPCAEAETRLGHSGKLRRTTHLPNHSPVVCRASSFRLISLPLRGASSTLRKKRIRDANFFPGPSPVPHPRLRVRPAPL